MSHNMDHFTLVGATERMRIGAPLLPTDAGQALRRMTPAISAEMNRATWFEIYQYAEPPGRLRTEPPPWGPIADAAELFVDIVTGTPPATRRQTLEHFEDVGREEGRAGHDLDAVQAAGQRACDVAFTLLKRNLSALELSDHTGHALLTAVLGFSDELACSVLAGYGSHLGLEAEIEAGDVLSELRYALLFGPIDNAQDWREHGIYIPEHVTIIVTALAAIDDVDGLMTTLDTALVSRTRGLFVLLADATIALDQAQTIAHHSAAPVVVGWPVAPQDVASAQRPVIISFREAEQHLPDVGVVRCDPDHRLAR